MGLQRLRGLQEVETLNSFSQYMKVARMSTISTGRLYPQGKSLVLISVRGGVEPRVIVRPEELHQ